VHECSKEIASALPGCSVAVLIPHVCMRSWPMINNLKWFDKFLTTVSERVLIRGY